MNERQSHTLRIVADDEGYNGFESFLNRVSNDPDLGSETVLRLRLVLEELVTNSLSYARNSLIDITLEIGSDRVEIHYEDEAPPFNPLNHLPHVNLDGDIASRPVGGLGCLLIVSMTCDLTHRRENNKNILVFTIPNIKN